ncbi:30S ribosomal protein S16 [Candidatus Babeliales bacterium]|nr:30S ribosomal protein S16 [Candidatus Babeliales bacterium]
MAVKIRFARIGKKHAPIYKIVAMDSRKKRDGMYLENLGTYNPKTKQLVQFHADRVQHWISLGAQPTDAIVRLMKINRVNLAKNAISTSQEVIASKKTVKKVAPKKADAASEKSAKTE